MGEPGTTAESWPLGNEYMNCVLINYPAAEERDWDAVVTPLASRATARNQWDQRFSDTAIYYSFCRRRQDSIASLLEVIQRARTGDDER